MEFTAAALSNTDIWSWEGADGTTMHPSAVFGRLAEIANAGGIEPSVAETYPLGEIAAAQECSGRGDLVGKLALVP